MVVVRVEGVFGRRAGVIARGRRLLWACPVLPLLVGWLLGVAVVALWCVPGSWLPLDGWAWRWGAEWFRGDRRRRNVVALAGWTMLRYAWRDLI